MITVEEGSTQRVVEDGRRFFKNIRIIHASLSALLLATGVVSLIFSLGADGGDAQIPYFFSAYIAFAWHLVFVIICQVSIHYLSYDRSKLRDAPTWVNAYTVSSSIFVIFNVMGIVFAVVNGLCLKGQLCYYDKNETANRSLAISLIFLHFVSILFSVFLAKKSHLIDSQLGEDITIRINTSFLWKRRKSSTKVTSFQHDSIDSINLTNPVTDSATLGEGTSEEGAVVVQNSTGGWLEKKRAIIIKTTRSKSHPNLRRHLDINQDVEGTVFSIYSDTEERSIDGMERRGKKRLSISKRNRVTPTKSLRDSSDTVGGSPSLSHTHERTECEIAINNPPVTVKIVEERKEKLSASLQNVKETGLLCMSRESSGMPNVDTRSNTEDSILTNQQEHILKQQELVMQQQEQLQTEQKDLMKQQREIAQQQVEFSGRTDVPDPFLSPPPPYPGHNANDVDL